MQEDAARAKKAGKIISPSHDPVKIFWHASRQAAPPIMSVEPTQGSEVNLQPETNGESLAPRGPRVVKTLVQVSTSEEAQRLPEKKNPPKSDIWSRLGPETGGSKEPDAEWTPDEAIGGGEEEDVDEGVYEGQDFLKELGNKLTGDEMDTIARKADHQYFLRSLMQPEAHDGPSTSVSPPTTAPLINLGQLPDSRQLYNIPQPNIPLLSHSRGNTAAECYEALDTRDQQIRKGKASLLTMYHFRFVTRNKFKKDYTFCIRA